MLIEVAAGSITGLGGAISLHLAFLSSKKVCPEQLGQHNNHLQKLAHWRSK